MSAIIILRDIITIAQTIHNQIKLAYRNKEDLLRLAGTVKTVLSSIKKLPELPNNREYIDSLKTMQTCLKQVSAFIESLSAVGRIESAVYARKHAEQIKGFETQILQLAPLLTVGLMAQQLFNQDCDRRMARLDHQRLVEQQARHFHELQALHLQPRDLERIIQRQLASLEQRLLKGSLALATREEQRLLSREHMVNFYDLVFEYKIGDSNLGGYFHGKWREQPVTIKWIEHVETELERAEFIREIGTMSHLQHESIMPFYGACFEIGQLCFLTEVIKKDDLLQIIMGLDFPDRLKLVLDLAQGLVYIHNQDMVHGNICANNVGINDALKAKWMNVGLVKTNINSATHHPHIHSDLSWQAPELWQRRARLTPKSDIYSFGLLLWLIVAERLPYDSFALDEIIGSVRNGFREPLPADTSPAYCALIESCWSSDVTRRPDALQIVRELECILLTASAVRAPSPSGEVLYQQGIEAQTAGELTSAFSCFQRSSAKGYVKSYISLGLFKIEGLTQHFDRKGGIGDLLYAANANPPQQRAMFNLGRVYEKGYTEDGKPDLALALAWYRRALAEKPDDARCVTKIALLSSQLEDCLDYDEFGHNFKPTSVK